MASAISFKPVRDNAERMGVVQGFLHQRSDLYGPQDTLITDIREGKVKCRLVSADGRYESLFIYRPRGDTVSIECFAPLDPSRFKYANDALDELMDMSKEFHPRAFTITLHKIKEAALVRFFQDQGFKPIQSKDNFVFLEKTRKRFRDEELRAPEPQVVPAAPRPFFKAARTSQLEVTLKQPYLNQIINGQKTIEGRINSGMFRNVKEGTMIRFFNQQTSVSCRVTDVRRYISFEQMLQRENFKACIPNANSVESSLAIYNAIPGYSQKAAQFGVLALALRVER